MVSLVVSPVVSGNLNRFKLTSVCTVALAFVLIMAQGARSEDLVQATEAATYLDAYRFKPCMPNAKTKIGVALGGGGARGAAHVGVLQVLKREGIEIDYVCGTSVGAIVGGLYAAGCHLDDLQCDAEKGSFMRKFMNVSLPTRLALEPLTLMPRLVGAKPYDGLYSGKTFRSYLQQSLPEKHPQIQDLKKPFAAVAFNLLDGKTYMIRGGDLDYAMQASSAVPGLRKPVPFGGKLFVDGGVDCNLPVKQCREMGADFVIAVNIDQPFPEMPSAHFRKLGSVTDRLINWDLWDLDKPQEQLADFIIHPDTTGISVLTTSRKAAARAYRAGVKAAEDAVPELKKRLAGATAGEK